MDFVGLIPELSAGKLLQKIQWSVLGSDDVSLFRSVLMYTMEPSGMRRSFDGWLGIAHRRVLGLTFLQSDSC